MTLAERYRAERPKGWFSPRHWTAYVKQLDGGATLSLRNGDDVVIMFSDGSEHVLEDDKDRILQ